MAKFKYLIIILFLISVYGIIGYSLIFAQPVVWSDEAVFADIANNFITQGKLAATVWTGLLPGVSDLAGWHPPFFFLTLASWFGLWGSNLLAQRSLSLLYGAIALVGFAWFSHRMLKLKSVVIWIILILSLSLDFLFIRAARISRPEILILALMFLNLNLLTYQNIKHRLTLSGIISGLALLSHPYGILVGVISLLYFWNFDWNKISLKAKFTQIKNLAPFWLLWFSPLCLWFVLMYQHWDIIYLQTQIVASKKLLDEFWWWLPSRTDTLAAKISFGILQTFSFGLVYLFIKQFKLKKKPSALLNFLGMSLIITWVFVFSGRMMWYSVYPILFIYLGLGYGLSQNNKKINQLSKICLVILLVANLLLYWQDWKNVYRHGLNYQAFVSQVVEHVPESSQVFLSTSPETYYGFLDAGRQNQVRIFPGQEVSPQDYLAVLNQTDYVVYNANLSSEIFGQFLETYLDKNMSSYQLVGDGTGHQAYVIELVDKNSRQTDHLYLEDWDAWRGDNSLVIPKPN